MGAVVHVPVEGSAVSPTLGISTDRLSVLNRKVVINPEVVANLVDKDLQIMTAPSRFLKYIYGGRKKDKV